ncbi:MAG: TRAP-type transport system small permease protein [Clostridiales bacterium]|jgi:TRAP-type C4-dicarboxylate transport system permease small subunit|nr:TRAP-type transport system small permease protein [Clostridiales bacterium]MDK2933484.1 TRAP-type transport system small permease protein [Clostridiales bacterium]
MKDSNKVKHKCTFYTHIKLATENILFILFAAMVIIVFINVVARYIFNNAITSSEEIARICFIWLVFIGATLALEEGEHLGIDLLLRLIPDRWEKWVKVLSNFLLLGITALSAIYGIQLTKNNISWPAPATGISYGIIGSILPISFFLMFLIIVRKSILLFKNQ